MDLRFETPDASHWIELRDARPADPAVFRGQLRFPFGNAVIARPFWFDRVDLEAFVSEARWLERSTGGNATIAHVGHLDSITLKRDQAGWTVVAEAFDLRDPDGRATEAVLLHPLAARELIHRFEMLAALTAPVS